MKPGNELKEQMAYISPKTLAWLREVFTNCGPFESDRELATVFVDERIAPWRDDLPEADSRGDRIDALIEYLYDTFRAEADDEHDESAQNALVLFTHVLADRTAPEDACYPTLLEAARRLTEEISQAEVTAKDVITARVPSISSVTDAALLDQLILNQKSSIRSYRSFAIGLIILGVIVTVLGFAIPAMLIASALKPWVGMGGIFIASLSLVQFREVLNRKEKIGVFTTIKARLIGMQQDTQYSVMHERLDELVWQVIERAAVE